MCDANVTDTTNVENNDNRATIDVVDSNDIDFFSSAN